MVDWHIINEKLRNYLFSLGLRDDEEGYWYIGQWDEWIMASYTNEVRIVEDLYLDKTGFYTGSLEKNLDVFKDEKQIINKIESLIKKYKELQIENQLNRANEDFV
jgi:hypothetical protein